MINELTSEISFTSFKEEVLKDYEIVCLSRDMSLLGRKEVLTGKAKFGIFGAGKELPQIAMAKAFQKGDFRWFVCTYRSSARTHVLWPTDGRSLQH